MPFPLSRRPWLHLIHDYLARGDPEHTVHYPGAAGRRLEALWLARG
jgi:hypothetical protein